ncbi:MAG: polysaccharide deacetylase family protein [Pseudomonadota bacterium]|nr:polysaccharide deacetylase family protein [Pseudomonadota bacterium]
MPSKIAASLRLAAVACLTLATLLFTSLAASQSIALTFDDGPDMADKTGLSAAERNAAILSQLAEAHIKSILFVTRTDSDKNRNELIRQWGEEGHRIGNHTATHPNFEQVSLADYEQEFRACDNAIRSMPGFARRFRFPYLKEGNTAEKRDGFRMFLDSSGYKPGPVSVDASDWYYSKRLVDRLTREPQADRLAYRDAYLRHLYDRAQYYDGLSRAVLGRSVAHVLLLHHNLINALFLRDVAQMFRDKGWSIIDSETAFQDPVYAMRPDVLPAGESILWALAKQKGIPGLRYPGEDDVYEKPILDRLHL